MPTIMTMIQGNDKLFELRPFLDHVVKQCKRLYKPNHDVSVDEQMKVQNWLLAIYAIEVNPQVGN